MDGGNQGAPNGMPSNIVSSITVSKSSQSR